MDPVLLSFWHMACMSGSMLMLAATSPFRRVDAATEHEHYAELRNWGFFPLRLTLPANTLICTPYSLLGAYYLINLSTYDIDPSRLYFFACFCWMIFFYGLIHCARLLTLSHYWAVLDQWYTLPPFSWVLIWTSVYVATPLPYFSYRCFGIGNKTTMSISAALFFLTLSCLSYFPAVIFKHSFDVSLGIHIVSAVYGGVLLIYYVSTNFHASHTLPFFVIFCKAILSCCAFVVLKVFDHRLASLNPYVFKRLSGHFWSKIGDILQLYYTVELFLFLESLTPKNG